LRCGGRFFNSPLRFFTEADRLENWSNGYHIVDSAQNNPNNWPAFPQDSPTPGVVFNRTYKHPFLVNALPGTGGSPLKGWMQDFVTAYVARQGLNPNLPNPDRFYFDTEPYIAGYDQNEIFMLKFLKDHDEIWSHIDVPGLGETLHQLYDDVRAPGQYGQGWPANILDFANGGLDQNGPGNSARNRQFTIWWLEICQRASDAVMQNAAYGVINAQWPACKTSNYDTSRRDGAMDTIPYFLDPITQQPNNQFARVVSYDPDWSETIAGVTGRRWFTQKQWTSATMDAPTYYGQQNDYVPIPNGYLHQWWWRPPLGTLKYCPAENGTDCGTFMTRRSNVDLPRAALADRCRRDTSATNPRRDQTRLQSTLAAIDQSMTAINYSTFGLAYPGNHNVRTVGWIPMAYDHSAGIDPYWLASVLMVQKHLRFVVGRCRENEIPELIGFSGGWYPCFDAQCAAYVATQWVFNEVYDPWIKNFAPITGTLTSGDLNPRRLELTTRDETTGLPSTVDLQTTPGKGLTELEVVASGLLCYRDVDYFDIIVKCWTSSALTTGTVYARDPGTAKFYKVQAVIDEPGVCPPSPCNANPDPCNNPSTCSIDYQNPDNDIPTTTEPSFQDYYQFQTPDLSTRRIFRLPRLAPSGQPFVDANGELTLRLVHSAPVPAGVSLVSRYDLVQVLPYSDYGLMPEGGGSSAPQEEAPAVIAVAQSDRDYDGEVAFPDLEKFLTDYAAGGLAADMNGDGVVDEQDMVIFVTHYVNGD
jgi:hypothetical protein